MTGCPELPEKRHVRKVYKNMAVINIKIRILVIPDDHLTIGNNYQLIFFIVPTFPKFKLLFLVVFDWEYFLFASLGFSDITINLRHLFGIDFVAFFLPVFNYLRLAKLKIFINFVVASIFFLFGDFFFCLDDSMNKPRAAILQVLCLRSWEKVPQITKDHGGVVINSLNCSIRSFSVYYLPG